MRLKVRFANNDHDYNLVTGSITKDNFNETLDNEVIHLTNIYEENRLHINPYDYGYIYDLDSDFIKYFVVDNYVESFVNITETIYDYQISLMSPTKWLEKIQLPNRTILHSLKSGQSTIREEILHFLQLYIPKIKLTKDKRTWSYDYLIDFSELLDETSEISQKFNVKCPDLSFNAPTLRQALINLMNIVGCTPIVINRKLSYLDFRKESVEFKIPTGKAFDFKNSLSSDSYVNTVSTFAESLLGEDNRVKNEILGFRDKDNAILRHAENLKITTRYPIAKVENLTICGNAKQVVAGFNAYWNGTRAGTVYTKMHSGTKLSFYINDRYAETPEEMFLPIVRNIKITLYSGTLNYETSSSYSIDEIGTKIGNTIEVATAQVGNEPAPSSATTNIEIGNNTFDYAIITFIGEDDETYCYTMINNVKYTNYDMYSRLTTDLTSPLVRQTIRIYFIYRKDITPIVKEIGEKKMLSMRTDNVPTIINDISDLATSYYTTLAYQYGGTTIEGFSQSYSFLKWYGENYTEIFISKLWEEIVKKWGTGDISLTEYLKAFGITTGGDKYELSGNAEIINQTQYSPYSQLFFDITYQPFNSVNLKFTKKEEIPIPIEQLDNQETSIPALIPFSLREQEKIDRLGNLVLQIHQSQVLDFSEINEINSTYGEYTIFSREIQYYEGFAEVNYVATKNYVLKNYFTSIETKYRAYEYVDFGKTIIRKENTKVFVLLSDHFVDGDDKIAFLNKEILEGSENYLTYISKAFLNLVDEAEEKTSFNYTLKSPWNDKNTQYKNDLSVLFFDNSIALAYRDFDSVSAGIKIADADATLGEDTGNKLNGYLQQWIIRDNAYNLRNYTYFTNLSLYSKVGEINYLYENENSILNAVENSFNMPELSLDLEQECENDENVDMLVITDYQPYFYNESPLGAKLYYKSQDEVLSETIQFEYYTDSEFIEIAPLIHKASMFNTDAKEIYAVYNTTQTLNNDLQESTQYIPINSIITRNEDGSYTINWVSTNINSIEIRILESEEDNVFKGYSLARIKKGFGNTLYVSLNDTKTTDVYSIDDNGLLNLSYKCDFTSRDRLCVVKE